MSTVLKGLSVRKTENYWTRGRKLPDDNKAKKKKGNFNVENEEARGTQ